MCAITKAITELEKEEYFIYWKEQWFLLWLILHNTVLLQWDFHSISSRKNNVCTSSRSDKYKSQNAMINKYKEAGEEVSPLQVLRGGWHCSWCFTPEVWSLLSLEFLHCNIIDTGQPLLRFHMLYPPAMFCTWLCISRMLAPDKCPNFSSFMKCQNWGTRTVCFCRASARSCLMLRSPTSRGTATTPARPSPGS